jgi:Glycosyl hydrolase catalytic core
MRSRLILPIAVLSALLLAAPASANFRVGLSEQNPQMFSEPAWQALHLKRVRYIVPWDWYKSRGQRSEVEFFMGTAHLFNQDVLATFTADRSCYVHGRYRHIKKCRAPSQKAYASAVKRFIKTYPWVKTYSVWNEANHHSQPTYRNPRLAAKYYLTMRKVAKRKTIVAADVLDQSDAGSYLRRFLHFTHNKGRIFGLHNYEDVNYHRSRGLKAVLRVVPGEVWLTETGGIVKFKPHFPRNLSRASRAINLMFSQAKFYNKRRHGMRSKVTRVYDYRWFGDKKSARFDAGLVEPNGKARKTLTAFKRGIRGRLR